MDENCAKTTYDDMEEYLKEMIDEGYIKEDGTPLKCFCGNTDFEMVNIYRGCYGLEEYALKCSCGKNVGHWAYGHWQI